MSNIQVKRLKAKGKSKKWELITIYDLRFTIVYLTKTLNGGVRVNSPQMYFYFLSLLKHCLFMKTFSFSVTFTAILYLALFTTSCKKDPADEESKAKGDLQVAVQCQTIPELTEGAEVYSSPPGITGVTDATGKILIRGISVGTYELYSYISGYGGGKTAVSIKDGELTDALIILVPGYDPGVAPIIESFSPDENSNYSSGSNIPFSVKVIDAQTPLQNIKVKVVSNFDGIIFDGNADATGRADFSRSLSQQVHEITVTATDSDGYTARFKSKVNVTLPPGIVLDEPEIINNTVKLTWTKSSTNDFLKYQIYFSETDTGGILLKEIYNADSTIFIDEFPSLAPNLTYYIKVHSTINTSSTSNCQTIENLYGYIIDEQVYRAVLDPETHSIYIHGQTKLYKINYETKELLDTWTAPFVLGGEVWGDYYVDMSFSDNGQDKELYIHYSREASYLPGPPNSIYILNAATLNLKKKLNFFDFDGRIISASCGDGNLFVLVDDYDVYRTKLYSIKQSTNQRIDSLIMDDDVTGLDAKNIPGKKELVVITTGKFSHIYYDNNGKFINHVQQQSSQGIPINDWLDKHPFVLSPDGSYFMITDEGKIYSTDPGLSYQNQLFNNAYTNDFSITAQNAIYSTKNEAGIFKYHYPELNLVDSYEHSRFEERFVRHDGNVLVAVMENQWNGYKFFVMTFDNLK